MSDNGHKAYTETTQIPVAGETTADTSAGGTPSVPLADQFRVARSRSFILTGVLVLAALTTWAALTEFEYTVAADGAIIPAGRVRTVQHADGGVVTEVAVKEGQLVQAGDVLVKLDSAVVKGLLNQAREEQTMNRLKAERLRATGEGREPNFAFAPPEFRGLVKDQWAVYNGFLRTQENRRAILESQAEQLQSDLNWADTEDVTLAQKAQILAEELSMREALYWRGLSPKFIMLKTQRQITDVRCEMAALITRRKKINKQIETVKTALKTVENDARVEALEELALVTTAISQVEERTRRLAASLAALDLRAPVRGVVKGVENLKKDRVVKSGEVVFEIVPVDNQLVAEVSIAPKNVVRLRTGQATVVSVAGAPGPLRGELRKLSSDTVTSRSGGRVYKGVIALDQPYVGGNPKENRLIPGMTVSVKILTGKRRVLDHLFAPQLPAKRLF
ncbi:MAG: HlyD family type I secretion periplasmic adaptor subunit [Rhodospirillaceae bacterium]